MKKTTIFILALLLILTATSIIYTTFPRLELSGSKNIIISYNGKYEEPGVIVKNATGTNMSNIIIENNIDITKIGNYHIDYYLKIGRKKLHVRRNVKVIDDVSPTIDLKGNQITTININNKYEEPGYKASDEYEGDLTDKVEIIGEVNTEKVGEYVLKYKVHDSSNNYTEINRIVKVIEETKESKQ